jgi:hypothetical protein
LDSGVSCQYRQQRWIYHDKKRVISDEGSGSKGSGVGVEPRKLNDGIAAPVWSLNINPDIPMGPVGNKEKRSFRLNDYNPPAGCNTCTR